MKTTKQTTILSTILRLALIAALVTVPSVPIPFIGSVSSPFIESASAQTSLTITTLSSDVADSQTADRITVASESGFTAGYYVYINRELMELVASPSGTTWTVNRARNGTRVAEHASGDVVYMAQGRNFSLDGPPSGGDCTATEQTAEPRIDITSGDIFNCLNGYWHRLRDDGFDALGGHSYYTYTAAGAITIAPGVHFIDNSGDGALAMTLADPGRDEDGILMVICSASADAHTVTDSDGFGGAGSGENVATYSGVAGDCMTVIAANSEWWVIALRQVTIA